MRIPRLRGKRSKLEQDPHAQPIPQAPKKLELPKGKLKPERKKAPERVRGVSRWRAIRTETARLLASGIVLPEGPTKRESKLAAYPSRRHRPLGRHGRYRGR